MEDTKTCQNCKNSFSIDASDFNFYEKIKVPPPTFCPECRQQRRLAIRNERIFYYRKCDLCQKKIISYYSPDKEQIVWCPKCWWSDKLDSLKYGRDFDFSKSFFEQFKKMYKKVPTLSLDVVNCKNSEYVSYCGDDNYCYMDIAGESNEYCYYCKFVKYSKDCIDCSFVYNSELNYECVNCHKIYGSTFLNRCSNCSDCHFLYDCKGCLNCFGCWNLRNKSYYIFNKPYSKEKYYKIINEFNRGSYKCLENSKEKFKKYLKLAISKFAFMNNCVNCTGNDLTRSKNIKNSFDVSNAENGKYLFDVLDAKECYDLNFSLYKPSFDIELISTLNMSNSSFCNASHYCNHAWYVDKCNSSSDLFGCIAVNKKKYCIFNKQYTKEKYMNLKEKIIEHMRKTGEYGEFFPIGTSGFGYNETVAQEYFPLTKEKCQKKNFPWWDTSTGTYGKETIKDLNLLDDIKNIDESILSKILSCIKCEKNYKIVSYELKLYKKIGVPLPRKCLDCRHKRRNKIAGTRNLWHRKCQCAGIESDNKIYKNTVNHPSHNKDHCLNEFETSYAPNRTEIVYCEDCYNKEVY